MGKDQKDDCESYEHCDQAETMDIPHVVAGDASTSALFTHPSWASSHIGFSILGGFRVRHGISNRLIGPALVWAVLASATGRGHVSVQRDVSDRVLFFFDRGTEGWLTLTGSDRAILSSRPCSSFCSERSLPRFLLSLSGTFGSAPRLLTAGCLACMVEPISYSYRRTIL